MKVLIVFEINGQTNNPFVGQLAAALRSVAGCEVTCSAREFWDNAQNYDVIHLQWPEALFDWHWPSPEQLAALEERLQKLKAQGIGIVYTRHNASPHAGNPRVMQGYRLVEQYADAVVHLGEYSRQSYSQENPPTEQLQEVIPHHIYEGEYNTQFSSAAGRRALGVPEDAFVVLAFGTFRHKQERQLMRKAFCGFGQKHKFLLAPRYFPYSYHSRWRTGLRGLMARVAYLAVRSVTWFTSWRITSPAELIPDAELPWYLAAADVVFIQRTDILNSGNVTLAFAFGKVVAGPDCGNIGEMLRTTGNPTFDPRRPETAAEALNQAASLARKGHGAANSDYATQHLSPARIAAMYGAVYETLHERRNRK